MDNLNLCANCWNRLEFINSNSCKICANYMGEFDYNFLGEAPICGNCQNSPPYFEQIIAVSYLSEVMQEIIYNFKFKDHPELSIFLAKLLTNKLSSLMEDIDIIIPIPLSFRRLLKRKYNQSALISQVIAKKFAKKIQLRPLLVRIKHTLPQTELNFLARKNNLLNAFQVTKPEIIKGKNILLIDDIVTTTATINEAAKTLKIYGANKVIIGAIARTKLHSY